MIVTDCLRVPADKLLKMHLQVHSGCPGTLNIELNLQTVHRCHAAGTSAMIETSLEMAHKACKATACQTAVAMCGPPVPHRERSFLVERHL